MVVTREEDSFLGGPRPFPETSWSMVLSAKEADAPAFQQSLDTLYRKYWGPVYFFVRRYWTQDLEEAKDLTQGFFVALIERDFLGSVDAAKGRFRNFVCAALKHWLANQKRAARAQKRSPRGGLASLEQLRGQHSSFDLADEAAGNPEDAFVRDWKRAIHDAALTRLREAAEERGRGFVVELLQEYDLGESTGERKTYQEMAEERSLTVHQVTNGLHWARKQFRALFLQELRDQVSSEEELREEAWELFGMRL